MPQLFLLSAKHGRMYTEWKKLTARCAVQNPWEPPDGTKRSVDQWETQVTPQTCSQTCGCRDVGRAMQGERSAAATARQQSSARQRSQCCSSPSTQGRFQDPKACAVDEQRGGKPDSRRASDPLQDGISDGQQHSAEPLTVNQSGMQEAEDPPAVVQSLAAMLLIHLRICPPREPTSAG